jgi:flagellar hook-associated protein 3 FlgL
MITAPTGNISKFLADLDRTQNQLQQVQAQVSSGLRVQRPSDDPSAIDGILETQTSLTLNRQVQSNIGTIRGNVESSDAAVQSAIKLIENAITLATQAASTPLNPQARAALATQVQGLQETLVGLSQTSVNGHFVFSGDQDNTAAYQLDLTQPDGVRRILNGPATQVLQDVNGTTIGVSRTAGEIFDPRNPDGTAASGNAFSALNALRLALQANDSAGAALAADALKQADNHLNTMGAFYGNVQARLDSATELAQKFLVNEQTRLSQLRDTDVAAAAVQLTQLQTQQQASLTMESKISHANLFDFLS